MYPGPDSERKYDSPGSGNEEEFYEDSPMDKAKETAGMAIDAVKANKKKIIIGLVALAILFFVADFFVFSIKEVSFSVNDTEGLELSDALVKISGTDGKEIETIRSGKKISLRKGTYFYSVALAGYKPLNRTSFEVQDAMEVEKTLEKNLKVEFSLMEDFPAKLVVGQRAELEAIFVNSSEAQEEIELVFEGGAGKETMDILYDTPLVLFPGQQTVTLTVQVRNDLQKNQIKNDISGTIRVQGLDNPKAKETFSFDLIAFNQDKLRISGTTNFGAVEEGTTSAEKKIKISNQNDFDIENLNIEILINETQFSPKDEVARWFNFSTPLPIPVIKAGREEEIGITVSVPTGIDFSDSATQENILGRFVFKTSFFEIPKELDLVVRKSSAKLEFQGISNTSLTFNSQSGTYPQRQVTLKLKNPGNLAIKNISLTSNCSGQNWITFSKSFVNQVSPKSEESVIYILDVPSSADSGSITICSITATYDNPRNIAPFTLEESQPFSVTLN